MADLSCDLSHCFLCRFCIPEWKTAVAVHKKTIAVKKGKTVFREGDPVTGIYFIYSGALKVHKQWTEGKELILRFAKGGDILGHRGLSELVYPVSTTALEDSTLCFISTEFLEATLKTNGAFTYEMLHFYGSELQKAENRMRNLAHMDVKGRIAEALLQLDAFFGSDPSGSIDARIRRQDIASYAGTTYETVFKFLAELSAAEVVATSGKSIRLLRPEALQEFIQKS